MNGPATDAPPPALRPLLEALGLKDVLREGWVRRGVDGVESVAAHSWGVAWLVMALLPPELDRGRALAYAVLHDLPEVHAGDIVPADGVSPEEKHRREVEGLRTLLAGSPRGPELLRTWEAYEAQADPEARFVRQLDRLDMALQAALYARSRGLDPREFWDSAAAVIEDPALAATLAALTGDGSR
ncbi:MAG: HD domain-containing protein [Deltaproteobacteria bacterium]|nr:MAG: HD domain-containing protein [Deltaproteobacteria bacterium]